jgi:hypothetical protein
VRLTVNHHPVSSIPCRLACRPAREGLEFVAMLPDSVQARALLAAADRVSGTSISYRAVHTRPDRALPRQGDGYIVDTAELSHISILTRPRVPAWHGTTCTVTRV